MSRMSSPSLEDLPAAVPARDPTERRGAATEVRGALRLGLWAGATVIAGLLLSGPIGVVVVGAVAPQPPWTDPTSFVAHYHFLQAVPFLFAFLMMIGFPAMHVAMWVASPRAAKPQALLALVMAAVFAALISFNYIAQTAIVPNAVKSGGASTIALLTMANPASICWSIEMFGYGFLGVASIFAAPSFRGSPAGKAASALLLANGVTSLASAALTSYDLGWAFTTPGFLGFVVWNALVVAMVAVIMLSFRRRLRALERGPAPPFTPEE
jgi:hypothetical protein